MPQERDEQLAEAQQQVLKLLRPGPLAVSGSDLDRSIINTAAVTAKEADPNTSNNTASARTTVLLFDTFCIA